MVPPSCRHGAGVVLQYALKEGYVHVDCGEIQSLIRSRCNILSLCVLYNGRSDGARAMRHPARVWT